MSYVVYNFPLWIMDIYSASFLIISIPSYAFILLCESHLKKQLYKTDYHKH